MKYDWKNEEAIPEYPMDLEMGDCISFRIRRNGMVFYRLLLMRNKGSRNKDYPFVVELRTVDCGGTERAVERAYSKSLESLFDIAKEKARRLREIFEDCLTDRDYRSED